MKARKKRFAVVHPIGRKPFRDRPELTFRDTKELVAQLSTYCRSKWPAPQTIHVDAHAGHILINGTHRASYSLHESREAAGRAAGFTMAELGSES